MRLLRGLAALSLLALAGCAGERRVPDSAKDLGPGEYRRVEVRGVQNVYSLGHGLYSGSAPEGDDGFASLKAIGVKTVLSVDGSAPEVELAQKHGLHYVHIPVGYDGIARTNGLMLVKAAETLPGPIFIHCHHGLHRGPAAAAVVCEGVAGWSADQAEAWMHVAGTATNYAGLYRTVREFGQPTEAELSRVPARFPSRARTPDLVNTMVQVDQHFDLLKAIEKAGFNAVPEHPDVTPANESLILYELFREAHRAKQGGERGADFLSRLAKAETSAGELNVQLKEYGAHAATEPKACEAAFQALSQQCAGCHKEYRN